MALSNARSRPSTGAHIRNHTRRGDTITSPIARPTALASSRMNAAGMQAYAGASRDRVVDGLDPTSPQLERQLGFDPRSSGDGPRPGRVGVGEHVEDGGHRGV